eukprot:TRINITY_DN487_c0_g1_i2.p1 TRINITY_DN487_c0_g1~~TRINITY_DN487_c0_g1_i2.p1  ORF type:complete len:835 (+),score=51.90 TRINITY_DN487_c0_g1_i2:2441-4945(+)
MPTGNSLALVHRLTLSLQCIAGHVPTWKNLKAGDCDGLGERSCAPTDWIPQDPGVPTCTVLASAPASQKSTCSEFCNDNGMVCVRGQDNTGDNTNCGLDARHNRQTQDNNGCEQSWHNQVCQCAKPACGQCGQHGRPACRYGQGCADGTVLVGNLCHRCGRNNWIPCQDNVCDSGFELISGRCRRCGGRFEHICPSDGCQGALQQQHGRCMCGRHNQIPCEFGCDPGFEKFPDGKCRMCGPKYQLACPSRGCDAGLDAINGRCWCGRHGAQPCGDDCDAGWGSFSGKCHRCGTKYQRPCPGTGCENGLDLWNNRCWCGNRGTRPCTCRPCDHGWRSISDKCLQCGAKNQHACPGNQCDAGLGLYRGRCQCGRQNNVPCGDAGCDDGFGDFNGVCKRCGSRYHQPCPVSGCNAGLAPNRGRCMCGRQGDIPCDGKCDAGHGIFDGVCKRCGTRYQVPCPAADPLPSCPADSAPEILALDTECQSNSVIQTKQQCESAAAALGYNYSKSKGGEVHWTGDTRGIPCGCSMRVVPQGCDVRTAGCYHGLHWNEHSSGCNPRHDQRPICCSGKADPSPACPADSTPEILALDTECQSNSVIQTKQQCESAAAALGYNYSKSKGGEVHWTGDTRGIPCGCSMRVVPQGCDVRTAGCYHGLHWNEHSSGCNPRHDQRPICCSGESSSTESGGRRSGGGSAGGCGPGLGLHNGRCMCGRHGQVPCTAGCEGGHTLDDGVCYRCGRHNQRPCARDLDCECDHGHRQDGDVCKICGYRSFLPCLDDDNAERCDVGHVVEDGRCQECGGWARGDQRACKHGNGDPYCREGKKLEYCKGLPICTDP